MNSWVKIYILSYQIIQTQKLRSLYNNMFVFSYSKRPFRRHHHRSRVCRHTTWPYQYTWAWHWTRPFHRQICFPDKLWPYNCSHLFHQYSPEHSDPKVRIPFRNCLVELTYFWEFFVSKMYDSYLKNHFQV